MFSFRAQRRISLLALFVLLWGLVFPALASAGVGDTNSVWTEICTAQGIKKVQQDAAGGHTDYHATAEHCALCCLGGMQAAVEPISLATGLESPHTPDVFPAFHVALPEQFVLLTAPPRAPPFSS